MNKFVLLLALVAVAAAAPVDSDINLLKRVMELLEEKRAMSFMTFNPSGNKLMVVYQASVKGDKSKTPTRAGVQGHHLQVFDASGVKVYETTEQYLDGYGAPTKTYELPFVKIGTKYTVKACEINKNGGDDHCSENSFTGGQRKSFF